METCSTLCLYKCLHKPTWNIFLQCFFRFLCSGFFFYHSPSWYHSFHSPDYLCQITSFSLRSLLSDITLSAVSCNFSVPHSPALVPSLHLFMPYSSLVLYPPHLSLSSLLFTDLSLSSCGCVCVCVWRLIAMPRSRCEVQREGFG